MRAEREPKLAYHYLSIETTRRCNMACAHCMRGNAQDMDMKPEYVDRILDTAEFVGELLFTGGEPTLNMDIIRHTLEYARDHFIWVFGLHIGTNGKMVPPGFTELMQEWFDYCLSCSGKDTDSLIFISSDEFHEPIPPENIKRLETLPFFEQEEGGFVKSGWKITKEGRAESLQGYDMKPIYTSPVRIQEYDTAKYSMDFDVHLACTGDIINGSNHSYEHMPEYKVGNVSDMDAYIRFVKAKAASYAA